MTLPTKIEFIPGDLPNNGKVIIEPCYTGYGITMGNAIRRVMLSSLVGAAITAVKISGALHELSTIPHVKEDVLNLILNLKLLCLKSYSAEEAKLFIKASGIKKITAKNITVPTGVIIANQDLYIATLTHKDAKLDIEITVSQGRGYVPVEVRVAERLDIGTIAVDAVFTPVRNVGFTVESVMVGETSNYDRLIIDITTNGTITPKEAFCEASQILVNHFNLCLNAFSDKGGADVVSKQSVQKSVDDADASDETETELAPTKKKSEKAKKVKK